MSLPYTQGGGVRAGYSFWTSYNVTNPFAQISVTRKEIDIFVNFLRWNEHYRFSLEDIQSIKIYNRLFSTGVQIVHSRSDVPSLIVFWTSSASNLNILLSALSEALDAPGAKRPNPETLKSQPHQKLLVERKQWPRYIFGAISSTLVAPFLVRPRGFSALFHPRNIFTWALLGILAFNWLRAGLAIITRIPLEKAD